MQVRVLQGAEWNDDKAEARWARRAWEGLGDDEPDDDDDDDDDEFTSLTPDPMARLPPRCPGATWCVGRHAKSRRTVSRLRDPWSGLCGLRRWVRRRQRTQAPEAVGSDGRRT